MINKTILITGGAGFIGTNLIIQLLNNNYNVISIDNYLTGKKENEQNKCKYINLDLSNANTITPKRLNKILDSKIDYIYHLAALARIQPSLVKPKKTLNNNINSTLNILEFAKEYNIPLMYAGSSSLHAGKYRSPYAYSKASGEELCKLYTQIYNMNIIINRFYNVYGPYQIESGAYSTVIGIFEQQYKNNKPLTIVGDGEQRRDFTHVNDIVDALIKCINKEFNANILELGRGIDYSINEVADMFGGKVKYIPKRDGEYDKTLCDYTKAKKQLNWEPKENLDEYISSLT